ncbi:unnamed protein product [Peronospora belbahrii]|uniref:Uncharacterized protein n=1 Tax=Peronospora belbahrii TaxID=622444 RepID=A0AAU9L8T1_9STRA|nr:unnamed protein product [Peronospora belbahrii]CAH0517355.1 unnamed protein product [Peronospora belbahrii]
MTTSRSERFILSLALSTVLTVCGYYYSKYLINRRSHGQGRKRLRVVPRQKLRDLQLCDKKHWVALCGTVFNVSGDPFFDATCGGIYSSWVRHDITYLILQLGLVPDARNDAEAIASYLDQELHLNMLQDEEDDVKRRRELMQEWFMRLYSRYEVVAQLSDRYVGAQWETLRMELLPSNSGWNSGSKCPLGFGAKTISKTTWSLKTADLKDLRTIRFQGRRYDVTESRLFHPDGGKFAHFVGHDVTYALAVQSMQVKDLDVAPERPYTFEEQLLLERYRNTFARELTLLEIDKEETKDGNNISVINLHHIIEDSDGMAHEECVECLKKALESATADQVNAVCARTMMTPLQKAVEKHRLDLVEVLVRAGADIQARAALYDDETPLQMAYRFHFNDIAAYLETVAVGGK